MIEKEKNKILKNIEKVRNQLENFTGIPTHKQKLIVGPKIASFLKKHIKDIKITNWEEYLIEQENKN